MSLSPRQPPGPEWVRAWKPQVAGVHEVFHARFVDYAYPPHVHDTWTVFILVRSFTQTFGIAPHRYLVARRIDAARKRLLGGEPIAQVAAGVGFYDQAHFTRLFKRHVGMPPGRYALSAAGPLPVAGP
jgi:hypothetical protein